MSLKPLAGRDRLTRTLGRAFARSALPQVLLLRGRRGVGKQRLALWIAQLLLCDSPGGVAACGMCLGCRRVLRLEHPDLLWYFPVQRPEKRPPSPEREEAVLEETRLEILAGIRENPLRPVMYEDPDQPTGKTRPAGIYFGTVRNLKREARRRPGVAERRVFMIAEAQELAMQESAQEAANALLKLFEEPPADCWFLLTTSEPGRVLETIRSRATGMFIPPLAESEVFSFLTAHTSAPEKEVRRVTHLSEGSVGRALGFLSTEEKRGALERSRQEAFHLIKAALDPNPTGRFTRALSRPPTKARLLHPTLVALESWLRDLAALAATDNVVVLNGDARARSWLLKALSRRAPMSPPRIAECTRYVEEARHLASGNVNPQLIIFGLLTDLNAGFEAATLTVGEEDS